MLPAHLPTAPRVHHALCLVGSGIRAALQVQMRAANGSVGVVLARRSVPVPGMPA